MGNSSFKIKGTYDLTYDLTAGNGTKIGEVQERLVNPFTLNFDTGGTSAKLGMRFNLAWFKLFADYNFQEYNTLTAGLSFSFR